MVTAGSLAYALRDVPLAELRESFARANLRLLVLASVPVYVVNLYVRALRWRHLVWPVASVGTLPLFRATAVGFLVNNLAPLRAGEIARAWVLARETGSSFAAITGTVVLERLLDAICVLAMAAIALLWIGQDSEFGRALRMVAGLAAPIVLGLFACLVALRIAPLRVAGIVGRLASPLPAGLRGRIVRLVGSVATGLGAVSVGRHLLWVTLHSVLLWPVLSALPLWIAFVAFDLDLGGVTQAITTGWVLLAALALAVSVPSVPGAVGPYQLAFTEVLGRLGIDAATAFAIGVAVWLVYWITLTVQGLVVLRTRRLPVRSLTGPPGP